MNRKVAILSSLFFAMPMSGITLAQDAPAATPAVSTPTTHPASPDEMPPAMRKKLQEMRDTRAKDGAAGNENSAGRERGMRDRRPEDNNRQPDGMGGPPDGGPDGGGPRGGGVGGGGMGGGPGGAEGERPEFRFSEEEWADVESFLKAQSPNRYAMYERSVNNPMRRNSLRKLMIVRYRQLQQISETDTDLYELMVQQFATEDKALGVVLKIRANESGSDLAAMDEELREIVKTIVTNSLQEREKRIGLLKQSLAREEKTLAEDKARSDELVTKRFDQIKERGPDALLRDPRGRWGGGGMGPPPRSEVTNQPPLVGQPAQAPNP